MGIAEQIRALSGKQMTPAFTCKVLSVDKPEMMCDLEPIGDFAEFPDSRIQASITSDAGVVIYPKVGSSVVALVLDDSHACVVLVSEVDEVSWKVAEKALNFTGDGLAVSSASSDLLKDIEKLIDEMANAIGEIAIMKVATPVGPGTVFPDTIAKLQAAKNQLSNVIKPSFKTYLNGA